MHRRTVLKQLALSFNVVWKTAAPIRAQPWSPFIAGNERKKDGPESM